MSYIEEISYYMNDRSEESNKRLAKKIVNENIEIAITEMAEHLHDKNKTIASDCIAVLYHVGYEKPEMIVPLTSKFHELLKHKNNRMVWGSVIALATISEVAPSKIEAFMDDIFHVFKEGTLISQVWAYKIILTLAKNEDLYHKYIDFLLHVLEDTRPIDFAKRAEMVQEIIRQKDVNRFLHILQTKDGLSKSAKKIVNKIVKSREDV